MIIEQDQLGKVCTQEERELFTQTALRSLDEDGSLTLEQKEVYRGLIELGGSEPDAAAAPRRRFW